MLDSISASFLAISQSPFQHNVFRKSTLIMYSFSLTATAATAALLAVAHATIPQELLDRKLPDCTSNGFDSIQDKGTFWYDTGAEQFADEFISSHANSDHTNWAQELYHDLFPDTTKSDYDCTDPDSDCVYAKDCGMLTLEA